LTDPRLGELGFTAAQADAFQPFAAEGLVPGRVVAGHTRYLRVATAEGETLAELAGSLRHQARSGEELPAVGDWVALRPGADPSSAVIQAVLPRRAAFVRRAAGTRTVAQVLAANVDTVFLVMGLDGDFNLRRIERALVLAWDSGATPVLLLNKADLCPDVEEKRAEVERIASNVPVCVVAAKPGEGLAALAPWLQPGRTVVLLGSSGVGKSTLVNALVGTELLAVQEIREDGRGRHTTSHRQLVPLPDGGMMLDTPGMRELQLWDADSGMEAAFQDLESLAGQCRFADCSHGREPGCAVRAALAEGTLDVERFESWRKLQRELERLARKQDGRARSEARKERARFARAMRKTSY
jgi:ribosome biogenesis GTPase